MSRFNDVNKLVTLSALSALAVILMIVIQIPYPLAPFLIIEISDCIILIVFALYGFKSAALVAVVKTLGDLGFRGIVTPFAVGQITAFIASISYVFLLKLTSKLDYGFKWMKLVRYVIIVLGITLIMTTANYLVLTPVFTGNFSFLDMTDGSVLGVNGSYFYAIVITYVPFNLLKGTMVVVVYALCINRVKSIVNKRISN